MSHAEREAVRLRTILSAELATLAPPVREVGVVQQTARAPAGLEDTYRTACRAIVAAEGLEKAAKAVAQKLRAAACASLAETGAPPVNTGTHVMSLREATPSAIITDPSLIPEHLWTRPEPKPNATEIAKLLRSGHTIAGATLENTPSPTLTIRNSTVEAVK